jgi:hypothetical protein
MMVVLVLIIALQIHMFLIHIFYCYFDCEWGWSLKQFHLSNMMVVLVLIIELQIHMFLDSYFLWLF